nr:MAG TPA: hypothetical protein [Caudoviricetes sp.]
MDKDKTTEEVVKVAKEVTLTKGELEYTLTDPVMIAAFKNQGFEVKE